MQKIEGSIKVYMVWDTEGKRWVIDPISWPDALDWQVEPYVYDDEDDHGKPTPKMVEHLPLAAAAAEIALDDLTLLGLEVVGETRASSPNLIQAIEKIFGDVEIFSAGIPKHSRDYLMAKLLPLFASVDANATLRTRAQVTTVYVATEKTDG